MQARARFDQALQAAADGLGAPSGTGLERASGTHVSFLEAQSDLVGVFPGWDKRRRYMLDWFVREPSYAMRPLQSLLRAGDRETAVARLVAEGLTNRQLAVRLGITERTPETHVDHSLTKLDFASRAQIAARIASSENLLR